MPLSDVLILFWLLPSLLVFLGLATALRLNGEPLESLDLWGLTSLFFISVFWPFGFALLVYAMFPKRLRSILMKERSWNVWGKKENDDD